MLIERAHLMRAESCLYAGEFQSVLDQCDFIQRAGDPKRELDLALAHGTSTVIMRGLLEAIAQWHRGLPSHAIATMDAALSRAGEIGHPLSLLYAKMYRLMLRQLSGQVDRVAAEAGEAVALAHDVSNAVMLAPSGVFSGWALL